MKKLTLILISLFIASSLFVGCSKNDETVTTIESAKPVKVINVKEEVYPVTLNYLGTVSTDTLKKFSFKSGGEIERVFVEPGVEVKKGDKLIQLNVQDLTYAVNAAKAQLDGAQAQYDSAKKGASAEKIKQAELNVDKAQKAYDFTKDNYDQIVKAYNGGLVSEQDLKQAELEMNLREADLEIAKQLELEAKNGVTDEQERQLLSQLEQARINYQQKKDMLANATMTSDIDGYVVDVLYKEGELVGAGYPVVIIRNKNSTVNVGLTIEDVEKVQIGTKTIITANGKEIEGTVSSIADLPDTQTRTYNVDIALSEDAFRIGTITEVTFILEENKGILIPITSIVKNGSTYVYTVEGDIVKKKNVEIVDTIGTNIIVSGLTSGDKLIVEGTKQLSEGDKVAIKP